METKFNSVSEGEVYKRRIIRGTFYANGRQTTNANCQALKVSGVTRTVGQQGKSRAAWWERVHRWRGLRWRRKTRESALRMRIAAVRRESQTPPRVRRVVTDMTYTSMYTRDRCSRRGPDGNGDGDCSAYEYCAL